MPSASVVKELNCAKCGKPLVKNGRAKCPRCKQEIELPASLLEGKWFCPECPAHGEKPHVLAINGQIKCRWCDEEKNSLIQKEEKMETKYRTDCDCITATTPEGIEKALQALKKAEESAKKAFNEAMEAIRASIQGEELRIEKDWTKKLSIFPKEVSISFKLDYPIKKIWVLRKTRYDQSNDKILIEGKGFKAIIPRNVDNHHGAQCSFDYFDEKVGGAEANCLIVKVLTEAIAHADDALLDRGVCWVYDGNPGTVHFNLENPDKHLAPGEIAGMIRKVKERAEEVLEDIFRGARAYGAVKAPISKK